MISGWLCALIGSIHSFEGYIKVCGSDCVVQGVCWEESERADGNAGEVFEMYAF